MNPPEKDPQSVHHEENSSAKADLLRFTKEWESIKDSFLDFRNKYRAKCKNGWLDLEDNQAKELLEHGKFVYQQSQKWSRNLCALYREKKWSDLELFLKYSRGLHLELAFLGYTFVSGWRECAEKAKAAQGLLLAPSWELCETVERCGENWSYAEHSTLLDELLQKIDHTLVDLSSRPPAPEVTLPGEMTAIENYFAVGKAECLLAVWNEYYMYILQELQMVLQMIHSDHNYARSIETIYEEYRSKAISVGLPARSIQRISTQDELERFRMSWVLSFAECDLRGFLTPSLWSRHMSKSSNPRSFKQIVKFCDLAREKLDLRSNESFEIDYKNGKLEIEEHIEKLKQARIHFAKQQSNAEKWLESQQSPNSPFLAKSTIAIGSIESSGQALNDREKLGSGQHERILSVKHRGIKTVEVPARSSECYATLHADKIVICRRNTEQSMSTYPVEVRNPTYRTLLQNAVVAEWNRRKSLLDEKQTLGRPGIGTCRGGFLTIDMELIAKALNKKKLSLAAAKFHVSQLRKLAHFSDRVNKKSKRLVGLFKDKDKKLDVWQSSIPFQLTRQDSALRVYSEHTALPSEEILPDPDSLQ